MGPVQLRSQRSTVDPSADTPPQARRAKHPSRPSRYEGSSAGKSGRALLAMGGEAFPDVGAAETEELQAKRRFERWAEHAIPVVQAVLGPTDRVLRPLGQVLGEAGRRRQHVVVVDAGGDQADALGFLAEQRLAREQVVLSLA